MKKETRDLLKLRAQNISKDELTNHSISPQISLVTFLLGEDTYGFDATYVSEVYPLKDFTFLPGLPNYITGVMNLRGQILAIIDIRQLFGLRQKGISELNEVILLQNEEMEFCILVDSVLGLLTIGEDQLVNLDSTVTSINSTYLQGITTDHLIVLDACRILSDRSIVVDNK